MYGGGNKSHRICCFPIGISSTQTANPMKRMQILYKSDANPMQIPCKSYPQNNKKPCVPVAILALVYRRTSCFACVWVHACEILLRSFSACPEPLAQHPSALPWHSFWDLYRPAPAPLVPLHSHFEFGKSITCNPILPDSSGVGCK